MRITQEKNVVLITILTAFALAIALWPAGASTARPGRKDLVRLGEAPIPSEPVAPVAADEPSRLRADEAYGKLWSGQVSVTWLRLQSVSNLDRSRAFAAS